MQINVVFKSCHFLANSPMTLGGRKRGRGGLEVGRLGFSWRKAAAGEGPGPGETPGQLW